MGNILYHALKSSSKLEVNLVKTLLLKYYFLISTVLMIYIYCDLQKGIWELKLDPFWKKEICTAQKERRHYSKFLFFRASIILVVNRSLE